MNAAPLIIGAIAFFVLAYIMASLVIILADSIPHWVKAVSGNRS